MRITTQLLKDLDACPDEVAKFKETFGEGVRLTRANLLKAADANLDLIWATNYADWLGLK